MNGAASTVSERLIPGDVTRVRSASEPWQNPRHEGLPEGERGVPDSELTGACPPGQENAVFQSRPLPASGCTLYPDPVGDDTKGVPKMLRILGSKRGECAAAGRGEDAPRPAVSSVFGLGLADALRLPGEQRRSDARRLGAIFGRAKAMHTPLPVYGSPSRICSKRSIPSPTRPVEIRGELQVDPLALAGLRRSANSCRTRPASWTA